MFDCKICGNKYDSLSNLLNHFRQVHKTESQQEYYDLYIKDSYKCKICDSTIEFSNTYKSMQVCSHRCKKELKKLNPIEKTIVCHICGRTFAEIKNLGKHLTETHPEINHEEYYNKYVITDKDAKGKCLWCNKELRFISIGMGYQKFCANTDCNVNWYNINTDRAKKAGTKISESLKTSRKVNMRKEYWLDQGYSEEDATKKISERQTTFSLERCIERYGAVEGQAVWQRRQQKWQDTLNAKPEEERARINRLKAEGPFIAAKEAGVYGGVKSKAECELCDLLGLESQLRIDTSDSVYYYDMHKNGKIIEYNGDYWHCNPTQWKDGSKYNSSIGMTAFAKWEKDKKKLDFAKAAGYKILVIWESEWTKDKQSVIDKCIRFINE